MSEVVGQPGAAALPRPMGIGEILSTGFQLDRRHWRTLLAIAAVVVVPVTLLHYLFGDLVRTQGETTRDGVVETAAVAQAAGLVADPRRRCVRCRTNGPSRASGVSGGRDIAVIRNLVDQLRVAIYRD